MDEPLEEWLTSIQVKLNPSFFTFLFDKIEVFLSNQHCLPVFRNFMYQGSDVIMMDRWKLSSTPSTQHQPSSGRGVDRCACSESKIVFQALDVVVCLDVLVDVWFVCLEA